MTIRGSRARALIIAAIIIGGIVWIRSGSAGAPRSAVGFNATTSQGTNATVSQRSEIPPTFRNQFTGVVREIAPGAQTGRHKYFVPSFVYVLEGMLTLSIEGHGTRTIQAGHGVAALVNVWHNGENRQRIPVKLLVMHFGGEDQKLGERSADPINWDFVVRNSPDDPTRIGDPSAH